ncbi:hypothetical protein BDV28DRAFT_160535 [Aspergillus coremiiformis]|uniref:Uncharacterized protein n=1 Tax=Aspergillus coremiiformis TaxID=138285 RepID=A0A5N6YXK5_9EURO|nr:hypothetical protein BDV28DRAFT_160535 [Aspergillus coremiiformis]
MLQQNDRYHADSIAPSPIIPIRRPNPQLSRRGHFSMSSIPRGDVQPPGLSDIQTRIEHVPDLVQFFQIQDSLSTGSSQSGGAREIFKAGQRRLRQLAQRPKKGAEPQTKAEEASRQLLVLQQEGFLPASVPALKPKKSPKGSIDSTVSSARSASNLSFQSNSRRDVESIGLPWLEDSLERLDTRETKGSHLSSHDLRDCTSLVDAAVPRPSPFEDVIPPLYQPSTQSNNDARGLREHSSGYATRPNLSSRASEQSDEMEALLHFPDIPDRTSSHRVKLSISANPSDYKQLSIHEQSEAAKPAGSKDAPEAAGSKSTPSNLQNTMQSHPNPVAQSLKLFPDTMPPRMPNKAAWRISNGCLPPSIRSLPINSAQQGSPVITTQPNDGVTESSSSTQSRDDSSEKPSRVDHMPPAQPTNLSRSTVGGAEHEKLTLARTGRRPASLSMGTIDAFPLPAPMRPLPALPKGVPGVRPSPGQEAPASRGSQGNQTQQEPQLPSRSSEEGSKGVSARRDTHSSISDRIVPDANHPEIAEDQGSKLSRTDAPSPSKPVPSVRTGQSRAERVRALKTKDISASRVYLKDSGNRTVEEGRLFLSSKLSQTASSGDYEVTVAPEYSSEGARKRFKRKLADAHSPLPSPPPFPSNYPRKSTEAHVASKIGNQPGFTNAASLDIHELSSKRNSRGYPGNSAWTTGVLNERAINELDLRERSETPLPSSEDEGLDEHFHMQASRSISSRRRRPKLTPIDVGESTLRKMRHTKKPWPYDYSRPMTPRTRRGHGLEKASPQSPHWPSSYYYHEMRDGRHRSSYVQELEKRIVHLEHQNKTLQAALLAALDVGGQQSIDGLLGGSTTSLSAPPTGRSFSSMTNSSSSPDSHIMRNPRGTRGRQPPYRPETWIASPDSSRRSSYGSEASADIRELEDMIEDFNFGRESDRASP